MLYIAGVAYLMMPFPTWEQVLEKLSPYGITLVCHPKKLVGSNGLVGARCFLKRQDPHCARSLAVDITEDQISEVRLLPSELKAICRRFKITDDPFDLEMG